MDLSPCRRVAFVVPRYGARVGGGAEALCRTIAHLVAADADVTVLTTCAQDYRTWQDHHPAGEERDGPVRVLRFSVPEPRDPDAFNRLSARAYAAPDDLELGGRWVRAEGPVAPGLLDHLREHGTGYDAVVFVPYLYATTVMGLPLVADRAVLLPALHDEPPAVLRAFDPVFAAARALMFSTPEERDQARLRFGTDPAAERIAGTGVDPAPSVDPAAFARARGIGRAYVVSVGRLDASKGVDRLVADHAAYRAGHPDGPDLVLVGAGPLEIAPAPWLHLTGYVEEREKHEAVAGAAVVIVPSPYESLSLAQMEAWTHGRATLANAASPVLVGQSRRSGGGLWYRDAAEYAVMLDYLVRNRAVTAALGRQGRRSVARMHSWDRVRRVWGETLRDVAAGAAARAPADAEAR